MNLLRIGTRKSPLAVWQAEYVRQCLLKIRPQLRVELVKMHTQGDLKLDTSLAKVGGKGLFTKELEQGLLEGSIDAAVHSMKDVTVELPPGLHIGAVCVREDPRDAFVSNACDSLASLPRGGRVGTSSLRRESQLRHRHPQLQVLPLRGNVNTRMRKLDAGDYDALILAAAGLKRLGLQDRIRGYLPIEHSLPAVGQGAIGIECRQDDSATQGLLALLDHADTAVCVRAERAMNARLQGGCQVPVAGYAELHGDRLYLRGLVGAPDGSRVIHAQASGSVQAPELVGAEVARQLLEQGGRTILDRIYDAR